MPAPYPSRSPVSLPGARRCRLARRLAAGLTPAEVAEVEATTEEEIQAFIADREFSRLVAQYRAARELPFDEQERLLIETAMADLQHLVDMGDRRALMFIVYEANRGRSPARRLVQLVRRTFEQATEPRATRPEPTAPPEQPRDSMAGYGQHPLGPAHAAAPRLADFIGAEAGRAALREAAREAAAAVPRRPSPRASPLPPPSLFPPCPGPPRASPSHRPATASSGCPATPASPTSPTSCRSPRSPSSPTIFPTSPTGSSAAASSAWPSWPKAAPEPDPTGPRRARGGSPSGRRRRAQSFPLFVTLGLDPRAHGTARRGVASVGMDPRIRSEGDGGGA